MKGVAVTGMGIISSIGNNLRENLESLKTQKDGISSPEFLKTRHKDLPVGEIKISNEILAQRLGLVQGHSLTRGALLSVMAIRDLLDNAGLNDFPVDTGFISGTSVGGIDATENFYSEYDKNAENRRFIQAQHPGFTTEKVAEYFGLKSFVTTISTACSSGANAIMLGARMINEGKLKRVIVGGSDCLTQFTLNGFNSLMILSKLKNRAFDENRDGLNLGEAAAYLLLEAEDAIQDRKILGRLKGFGNANDAFHQTASSENGEGAFLAISKALKQAEIGPEDINYVNAHGTGTRNNDLAESMALKRIFANGIPLFSSTKGYTGHTLGAAGAVEAVYSLLSINNNLAFPNLNFQDKMKETALVPINKLVDEEINTVLSNSFGFGGNCTSLIFGRDA